MVQQLQITDLTEDSVRLSAEPVRSFMGQKERSFWIENRSTLDLEAGIWVEVRYSSGRSLLDIFLLLMLPVILVVLIAHLLPSEMPAAQQVVWSLMGLPVGIGIFALNQRLLPQSQPEISRVLNREEITGRSSGCGSGCMCKT